MSRLDNQYFTYRQNPVDYDGTGTIESLKGSTLVWNQLVENGDFRSTRGWLVIYGGTISASNNILTYTQNGSSTVPFYQTEVRTPTFSIPKNHKVFIAYDIKPNGVVGSNSQVAAWSGGVIGFAISPSNVPKDVWTHCTYFGTFEQDITWLQIRMSGANAPSGFTANLKNVQVFDLTQMFGSGNEPSSVEEFTSLFNLPYYKYDTGSLLSFMGNGIKTVGKNLFNAEWESGSIGGTGNNIVSASDIRTSSGFSAFFFEEGKTYTFSCEETRQEIWVNYYFNDGTFGRTKIGVNTTSASFTVPNGVRFIRFRMTKKSNDLEPKAQVEYGTSASSYVPYTESVLSLPISTYFPSGMKSAGSVYDELTESKAITRIGAVDLGSLSWTYSADSQIFTSGAVLQRALTQNGICARYEKIDGWTEFNQSSKSIFLPTNSNIVRIKDSAYTDATTFKTAMSSVMLYYELATPTETDISPELDLTYNIYKDGTEQLYPYITVDLGDLDWTAEGSGLGGDYEMTSRSVPFGIDIPSMFNKADISCSAYTTYSYLEVNTGTTGISVNEDGKIVVYDPNYNQFGSTSAFKTAMSGVKLTYRIFTTPFYGDIYYRGLIPVSVNVYPLGSGTVTGSGQYRYHEDVTLVATPNDLYRFLRYEDENGDTLSTSPTYTFEVGE